MGTKYPTHVFSAHSIVATFHLPSHAKDKCRVRPFNLSLCPHESTRHGCSCIIITTATTAADPSTQQPNMEEDWKKAYFLMPNPLECFTKLIFLQADLIYNCLVSLFSPVIFIFSVVYESYQRAEEAKESMESAVQKVPSSITHGSSLLLKKLCLGLLGAAYVGLILIMVLVLAIVVGVGLVQLLVDHPVFVREKLYFDYTEAYPKAVFCFSKAYPKAVFWRKQLMGVPTGHTFDLSLELLMPESDFNRRIGVFQLSAELLSVNGAVIAQSSQPCMLRFRSFPIRYARTFILGVPILLGISDETQKISIKILKHKEGKQRTEAIRVTIFPRAGTFSVLQLYEAEILVQSQLPWAKKVVYNWKWTLYVWTSLYIYILFLIVLLYCCKAFIFPTTAASLRDQNSTELTVEEPIEPEPRAREKKEASELLARWRSSRSKRKAIFLDEAMPEAVGSSASSISFTREETSTVVEESGDSESVFRG